MLGACAPREATLTRAHGRDGAMTLRRHPRELYRVFTEEEFLRLGDWQRGATLAGHAEVATRLSRGGRGRSGQAAIAPAAGRPLGLLIGATVVTGLLGAVAWLLAASSYTRISAARRWQGRGALTASSATDAARAAVAAVHASRLPRLTATPGRRHAAGRRNARKVDRAGAPTATAARAGDAGVRPGRVQPARLTPPSSATRAPEATSSHLAARPTPPSGSGAGSRLGQTADFTFER